MLHNKTIEITSVLAPFKILLRIVQKKEKKNMLWNMIYLLLSSHVLDCSDVLAHEFQVLMIKCLTSLEDCNYFLLGYVLEFQ